MTATKEAPILPAAESLTGGGVGTTGVEELTGGGGYGTPVPVGTGQSYPPGQTGVSVG